MLRRCVEIGQVSRVHSKESSHFINIMTRGVEGNDVDETSATRAALTGLSSRIRGSQVRQRSAEYNE